MFRRKTPPEVVQKNRQADKLKATIVNRSNKITTETANLNKLLFDSPITFRFFVGTGGEKRHD